MKRDFLKTFISAALLEYSDAACGYESSVIKSLKSAGAVGSIKRAACSDSTRPDADIKVGNDVFYVEVKSTPRAQMGGGSIGYSLRDKRFYPVGQNRDISAMMVDVLNEVDDTSLHKGLSTLLKHLSRSSGKQLISVPVSGFTHQAWDDARDFGLLQAINRTFSSDVSVIARHYAQKETFYVQIGGVGFFRFGEANPAGLRVPQLKGKVKLEVRLAKSGSDTDSAKAGLRVQARLYALNSSPYTLDDPDSVKSLLTVH